jgi:hypothetical protein
VPRGANVWTACSTQKSHSSPACAIYLDGLSRLVVGRADVAREPDGRPAPGIYAAIAAPSAPDTERDARGSVLKGDIPDLPQRRAVGESPMSGLLSRRSHRRAVDSTTWKRRNGEQVQAAMERIDWGLVAKPRQPARRAGARLRVVRPRAFSRYQRSL